MRMKLSAALLAAAAIAMSGAARADTVRPFTANDTGGIISYSLVGLTDIRALAADNCARYGKVARFTSAERRQGGYMVFVCVWVPPRYGTVLRVRY